MFDDDLSEDDEEMIVRGEDGWGMGSDAEGGEDSEDDDEEEDDEDDEDDEEDEEDEEDDEDEGEDDEQHSDAAQPAHPASTPSTRTTLDPLAALQASKSKEITKGRAILRQQVCPAFSPSSHRAPQLTLPVFVETVRRAADGADYVSKGVGCRWQGAVVA